MRSGRAIIHSPLTGKIDMANEPNPSDYIEDDEPVCVNCNDEGCEFCDDDPEEDYGYYGDGFDEW
jgi:hypothetical protein